MTQTRKIEKVLITIGLIKKETRNLNERDTISDFKFTSTLQTYPSPFILV